MALFLIYFYKKNNKMKVLLSFLVLMCFATSGFSQKNEFLKKKAFPMKSITKTETPKPEKPKQKPESKPNNPFADIAPINTEIKDKKAAEIPNPFSNPKPMMPSRTVGVAPMTMEKPKYINPGNNIVEKLNKKVQVQEGDTNIDYSVFRKNESFGEFKTKGDFVTLDCRDYGEVDGDKIALFVNDRLVESEIFLEYEYKKFNINLIKGINKIEFLSLNEGYSSPNTTQFVIFDYLEKIMTGLVSAKATGFKASIIIVRE
jgi:hypothetical protein